MSEIITALQVLFEAVKELRHRSSENKEITNAELAAKEKALKDVMLAIVETKAYLADKKENSEDRDRERELSRLWLSASSSIKRFDRQLFRSAQTKALGWADHREWQKAKEQSVVVKLDALLEQCNYHHNQ